MEEFLETAAEGDPLLVRVQDAARRFREIFEMLAKAVGTPAEVLASGNALLKSPSLSQRMADALGALPTLSTEPEPAGRGAARRALGTDWRDCESVRTLGVDGRRLQTVALLKLHNESLELLRARFAHSCW